MGALDSNRVRNPHLLVFFFVFLAPPTPLHPEYGAVDGAYVSCWVNDPVEASAEAAARGLIEAAGWDVDKRDEAYLLVDDHYAPDQDGYERVAQARVDGICATFHRWALGAPDE